MPHRLARHKRLPEVKGDVFRWILDFASLFSPLSYCQSTMREGRDAWELVAQREAALCHHDDRAELVDLTRNDEEKGLVTQTTIDGYDYRDQDTAEETFHEAKIVIRPFSLCSVHLKQGRLEAEQSPQHHPNREERDEACLPQTSDMIAEQPIINLEPYELLENYYVPSVKEDDDVFRTLRRERRNLVIDSIYPDVAPHIIITPPEPCWHEYYVFSQNAVDPQWPQYLTVPHQTYGHNFSAHLPPMENESSHNRDSHALSNSDNNEVKDKQHATFFNHFASGTRAQSTSKDNTVWSYVLPSLYRHHYKAIAFSASHIAPSFRRRYEAPDFIRSIERPFHWSDPAEPLLAVGRRIRGTTILDSTCPFIAPHIMINEDPPQSPWIAWHNATSDPQDCDYGNTLTVPSHSVHFINSSYSDLMFDDEDQAGFCNPWDDEDFSDSRPETPVPETPLCSNDDRYFPTMERDCESSEDLLVVAIKRSSADFDEGLMPSWRVSPEKFSQLISCEIILEEDEEDDLPPLDEWYQEIAKRAQLIS